MSNLNLLQPYLGGSAPPCTLWKKERRQLFMDKGRENERTNEEGQNFQKRNFLRGKLRKISMRRGRGRERGRTSLRSIRVREGERSCRPALLTALAILAYHGCQMAIAKFLDCMFLALRAWRTMVPLRLKIWSLGKGIKFCHLAALLLTYLTCTPPHSPLRILDMESNTITQKEGRKMLQLKDELMHERENTFNLHCKIKWPWEAFSPFPQWLGRPQFPRCLWRTLRALSLQSKFWSHQLHSPGTTTGCISRIIHRNAANLEEKSAWF